MKTVLTGAFTILFFLITYSQEIVPEQPADPLSNFTFLKRYEDYRKELKDGDLRTFSRQYVLYLKLPHCLAEFFTIPSTIEP